MKPGEKDKAFVVKESLSIGHNYKNEHLPISGILGINLSSEFSHIVDKTEKCHESIFELLRLKVEQEHFSFKNKSYNL